MAISASVSVEKRLTATTTGTPYLRALLTWAARLGSPFARRSRFSFPYRRAAAARRYLGAAAVHLEGADRRHDHDAVGGYPDALHLILMNFSSPHSAPKPASVIT